MDKWSLMSAIVKMKFILLYLIYTFNYEFEIRFFCQSSG